MKYSKFKQLCDKYIIYLSQAGLLSKIINYKNKFFLYDINFNELFLKNLLIRFRNKNFGILFKVLFREYFNELGYRNLDRILQFDNGYLDLDQLFTDDKYIYFVEQKIRDDHDSTKKRGQFQNFENKIISLLKIYNEKELKTYTYFIDPSLVKNKNYYFNEISKLQADYNIYAKLCYGEEFWIDINHKEVWDEILLYLKKWKDEIPDMPSINFDEDFENSFEEIKNISTTVFRKILSNRNVCNEIFPIIFPEKKILKLLKEYFIESGREKTIYKNLAEKILL